MQLFALNFVIKVCTLRGAISGKRNLSLRGTKDNISFIILFVGICLIEFSVLVSSPKITFPSSSLVKVSYFDEEELEGLQRRARDENGNPILVPQDMNYRRVERKICDK